MGMRNGSSAVGVRQSCEERFAEGKSERIAPTNHIDPFLLVLRFGGGGGGEEMSDEDADMKQEGDDQAPTKEQSQSKGGVEGEDKCEESRSDTPKRSSHDISIATPTKTQVEAMSKEKEEEAEHQQRYERENVAMKAWEGPRLGECQAEPDKGRKRSRPRVQLGVRQTNPRKGEAMKARRRRPW